MGLEVFLKSGMDVPPGAESLPPYIIHFEMDWVNVRYARDKAKLLLQAVDRNVGREIASDTERAEYLIADTLAANAHTDQAVMQVLAFVLVFLCSDSPEKLASLASGTPTRTGYLLTPRDAADGAADPARLFRFRHVTVAI